ncbi:unnamed protein product [Acanthoscelides obtectus]|uniref:Uncharacterized protein n=1 Tax=Acanthoscelides obtectus TaxID=200917 RepID=A0A9P0K6T7_ACAOB|nr:unnamed protein product [Acanthoscelides obtectus]CAK1676826.1 Zinc finger protein 106 [Acanthoscelides obtectus]
MEENMDISGDSADENVAGASSESTKAVADAKWQQLPTKSKKLYLNIYYEFVKWCDFKSVKEYEEDVFLAFFEEKAEKRKPSSLWAYFSMLKATILLNHNIDIGKYSKLVKYLKDKNDGYKPTKSRVLNREDINRFIKEAPDDLYLMIKVALIFGVCGPCRREELANIMADDIQDLGDALLVTIRDKENKIQRAFTVSETANDSGNFLETYRKYVLLRPPDCDHRRFFVFYKNYKCSKQVVGKNMFGQIPFKVATFLKLPNAKEYTGHCFKRSSATLLENAGGSASTSHLYMPEYVADLSNLTEQQDTEPRLTEDQVLFNNIKTEPPDECYSASEETMMKVPVSPTKDENEIFLNDIKQESLDTEDLKELEDTSQNDDILKNGTRNINKDPDGHSTDLGTASIATQTDSFEELPDVGCWLKKTFRSPPKDISEAVDRMFRIDQIISDLNQYRQSLFTSFVIRDNSAHKMQKRGQLERFVSYSKKARQDGDVSLPPPATSISDEISEAPVQKDGEPVQETRGVNFELHEKVLSTRVDGNMLLAGTESGKLYMHDLSGTTELKSITVSEQPVISVISVKDATTSEILAASFDNTIRMYDVHGLKLTRTLNTEGMVQCMDEKWEYVFMGTSNGYLMRYSLKKNEIEFEEKFNDDCILTLKAISEGARKVLLVGSKGAPVCFRDAISGLHLRTLQHNSPRASVFSIIVDVNVYCATDNHVQVFSFHVSFIFIFRTHY